MSLVINHNFVASNAANNLNSHYKQLDRSIYRLATGLRINSAADDAAGLAVRELQRADIAAFQQGVRNVRDAISFIQTADGALGVIDEKLIRMKELAEQAATGTYDSTQRMLIDFEFQEMADEINRIATSTEFNGQKILNGPKYQTKKNNVQNSFDENVYMNFRFDNSLKSDDGYNSIIHNNVTFSSNSITGESLDINGAVSDAEEPDEPKGGFVELPSIDWSALGNTITISISVYQKNIVYNGQENYLSLNGNYAQIYHDKVHDSLVYAIGNKIISLSGIDSFNLENRWVQHTMVLDGGTLTAYQNGIEVGSVTGPSTLTSPTTVTDSFNAIGRHWWTHNGNYRSSARFQGNVDNFRINSSALNEDEVMELYNQSWQIPPENILSQDGAIPSDVVRIHFGSGNSSSEDYYDIHKIDVTKKGLGINNISINTQDKASQALLKINKAITIKDEARAELGALQNRFENTITNISTQYENLQASESRISDVDVATEMTKFVRHQILSQSAVSMLAQANSLPQMAMRLISS